MSIYVSKMNCGPGWLHKTLGVDEDCAQIFLDNCTEIRSTENGMFYIILANIKNN